MGGYLNDGGKINLERLQMILDEMGVWEREEVFRREYFDSSWLKGKTDGKGKGRGKGEAPLPIDARGGLRSMTESQRVIFDKVKDFVRSSSSSPALKMKNDFAARDRKFVTMLCEDLRLDVAWDEFDEDGGNLCVVRTPVRAGVGRRSGVDDGDLLGGTLEGAGVIPPSSSNDASSSADDDGTPPSDESTPLAATPLAPELDSSDEEEEEESRAAIDRVLSKFERMAVVDDSEEAFEKRQARGVEEKMAEWKGEYYLVGFFLLVISYSLPALFSPSRVLFEREVLCLGETHGPSQTNMLLTTPLAHRRSWTSTTRSRRSWARSCIDMWRGCSG
ncbi:hypothetical protein BDV98DRAFT_365857 [Pterulicium gracile]|uniref:Uncharacterized protein n=1 Tax=Pterulicium gracile TaxID=1884261 RepID=A0A5C3QQV1_9AGAR|nr:hypothetical protein BDV98DRAFT_365857 [Pterula gracilis]